MTCSIDRNTSPLKDQLFLHSSNFHPAEHILNASSGTLGQTLYREIIDEFETIKTTMNFVDNIIFK